MFSMGRDRRLPLGGAWGHVNSTFHTPANASIAVGVLAAIPFVVTGAGAAIYIAIAATGMIYICYFLCNLGVLVARTQGLAAPGRLVQARVAGARSSTSSPCCGAA